MPVSIHSVRQKLTLKKKQPMFDRNMAPPLTIRNHTSSSLWVKLIERYEAPGAKEPEVVKKVEGEVGSFLKNLTDTISNLTDSNTTSKPSRPRLAENAQSFAHQDVNIEVKPFEATTTDIKATERGPSEILRITIEADGQRYRVDTPSPDDASQVFTPLVQDAKHNYTGVFVEEESHLSVFSSANLQAWMKELRDETPLSALSLPGTHNSPTCHRALPSVRCQAVSPREQLDNGVRFFDLRVQPESPNNTSSDKLILVHSVFPISLTGTKYFRDLYNEILDFLSRNPSETIIISVKREGTGDATDQQLSRTLFDHYASRDPQKWFTEPRIARLGESRGKMVLFRRFNLDDAQKREHGGKGWGLDAAGWADNTPCDYHGDLCVQDFYEVLDTMNIDKKITYAQEQLDRSGVLAVPIDESGKPTGDNPHPLFVNFLSASNFWNVNCWPDKIAAKINPAIIKHLCTYDVSGGKGDGATGVVVCDWVGDRGDWDIVRCIVGQNGKVELREKVA